MPHDLEQQRDWEELSRLREENRILRQKNARLKAKMKQLHDLVRAKNS